MSNESNDELEVPGAEDEKRENGDDSTKQKKHDRVYVAKNSLVEEELVKARDAARARVQGKKREDATDEEIHEDRRAANRLASFQSRKRRKGNIDELEKTVAQLEAAGEDQRKEMEDQRERLQAVQMENEKLREQLSASAQQSEKSEQVSVGHRSYPDVPLQGDLQHHRKQQSDDHKPVYDMLAKLNQLQTEHQARRQAQENRCTQDRQVLQARHAQQQQHLRTAQSEQLKQLDGEHMEEQRQLVKKHDDEVLHHTHSLGFLGNAVATTSQEQQETAAARVASVSNNQDDSDNQLSAVSANPDQNNPTDQSSSESAMAVSETVDQITNTPTGAAAAAVSALGAINPAQLLSMIQGMYGDHQK
jgi:regulator of replication initiation timing